MAAGETDQRLMDESTLVSSIISMEDSDFKIIAEATIVYLFTDGKTESLNTLNDSLIQVNNCKETAKWLLDKLSAALKQGIDESKILKHFQSNFGLDEAKSTLIKEMWVKHWEALKKKNESQNLMISQLVDMEWNFGVTASTNLVDKLGNAFLQLKLVYNQGGNLGTRFVELTLPQFYSFLHEMNKAKSQMDYLS